LRRVLATWFHLPAECIEELDTLLRTYEVMAKPDAMDPVLVRDAADRWVLANARAAQADVLITGDADLLAVAATAGLRIVTPREFWEELRRGAR
ncbi:MAG: PIN domain-containing protein, partial [Casimicrobiaceae bacterium]